VDYLWAAGILGVGNMRTKELVYGALLTALALLIPLAFGGFLSIMIPPFSATLASHLPVMIAMLISPQVAIMVGLGSSLGFLIKLGPIIAARAAIHAIFGAVGAIIVKRGFSFGTALLITLPVHAVGEALIVLPFGFSLQKAGLVIGVGTALHHLIDAAIAVTIVVSIGLVQKAAKDKH
jgi:niacin transporter